MRSIIYEAVPLFGTMHLHTYLTNDYNIYLQPGTLVPWYHVHDMYVASCFLNFTLCLAAIGVHTVVGSLVIVSH